MRIQIPYCTRSRQLTRLTIRRQRQVNASTTPFSLAQKYLPRELLQEIRMPQATLKSKRSTARKRNRMEMETIDEEAEE